MVQLTIAIDGSVSAPASALGSKAKRLLSRSRAQRFASRCWEAKLLQHLLGDQDLSIAHIYGQGEQFPVEAKHVLRCDPVQLIADRDALFVNAVDLNLNHQECSAFADMFNQHFEPDGLQFVCLHPQRWYITSEKPFQFSSEPLVDILGKHLDISQLFSGPEAALWRSRLNEMQMLLYNAPVNEQREAFGKEPCSSVWFWGGGEPLKREEHTIYIMGEHPFANGLAKCLQTQSHELKTSGDITSALKAEQNLWVTYGYEVDNIYDLFDSCAALLHNERVQDIHILTHSGGLHISADHYRSWWKKNKNREQQVWQDLLNVVPSHQA